MRSRQRVRLAPHPVLEAVDTCAYGIDVRWKKAPGRWQFFARFPEPTAVELVLPFPPETIRSVRCNGEPIDKISRVMTIGPRDHLAINVSLSV